MIVLDTNVLSEASKPRAEVRVVAWLNTQAAETLYLSAITLAELTFGLRCLPEGRRKMALEQALEGLLAIFRQRVLPFDTEAARCYADLAAEARAAGKRLPLPDGYIAAIAKSRGFAVATRDTKPFRAAGLTVIDPWKEP